MLKIETCKEFINDKKYADVKDYFLSAFKAIDKINDKIMSKIDFENLSEEEYEKWANLLEDIGEISNHCIGLLERAYYD